MQPKNKKVPEKRYAIQIRADEELHKQMKMSAKEAGMNMTDFIYFCTLKIPPRTKMATAERELFIHMLAEYGKIRSNVNQIDKIMTTEKGAGYSVTLKESVIAQANVAVRNVSDKLLHLLEHGVGKMATDEKEIFIRQSAKLDKIGSDVNQVAKAMNTDKGAGYSVMPKESVIVQALDDVRNVSNVLLNLLEHGVGKGQSAGERQPACDVSTDQSR